MKGPLKIIPMVTRKLSPVIFSLIRGVAEGVVDGRLQVGRRHVGRLLLTNVDVVQIVLASKPGVCNATSFLGYFIKRKMSTRTLLRP